MTNFTPIDYDPSKAPSDNGQPSKYTHKQYIDAYNEHKSFRAAGRALGVSHMVISKNVAYQLRGAVDAPKIGAPKAFNRMYWDIETSPCIGYFWRPSYKASISYDNILEHAKIICICWKWEGEEDVYHLTWDEHQNDAAMVRKFATELMKADEAVAHNGDRFDLKWLKTRFLVHGVEFPAKIVTTDTLKRSRGNFNFPTNRLNDIGDYLGEGTKMDTGGFGLWKDVMDGDVMAMQHMVDYCIQDVILLERVHHRIRNLTPQSTHAGAAVGGHRWSCPISGSNNIELVKTRTTPTGILRRVMKCMDNGKYFEISNKVYMDFLAWRINNEMSEKNKV